MASIHSADLAFKNKLKQWNLETRSISAKAPKSKHAEWAFPTKIVKCDFPSEGFKIHLSATVRTASKVLDCVVPLLLKHHLYFKCAGSLRFLQDLNAGFWGLTQVGKFLTIYPPKPFNLLILADTLYRLTKGIKGPRIPSDALYRKNGIVYYRYGSFIGGGKDQSSLTKPNGEKVDDKRNPLEPVPEWVKNPFCTKKWVPEKKLFLGRFLIFEVLRQRGKGGVYGALEFGTTNGSRKMRPFRKVVIKEARYAGEEDFRGIDATQRLTWEYSVMKILSKQSRFVPQAYDLYQYENHKYLIMEYIEGTNLNTLLLSKKPLKRVDVIPLFSQLLEAVGVLHKLGYFMVDNSPDNILIDRNGKLYLTDFEYVFRKGGLPLNNIGTPGFYPHSEKEDSNISMKYQELMKRDLYALGALLYVLLSPRWYKKIVPSSDIVQYWNRPSLPKTIPGFLRKIVQGATSEKTFESIQEMRGMFYGNVSRKRKQYGHYL